MTCLTVTNKFTFTFISAIVLLLSFQHVLATRPLDEEDDVPSFDKNLIVQSLQRGPVPPSAGNPCTNIPGRSRGRCTLTEMNTVGGDGVAAYHAAPPAFPEFVVKFASASAGINGTDKK
ncbi:Phosphoribosylaminoimidazole carboxylase atpase-subunit isoform 1 [Hibiscus syriacus]|uniref:Phosphoribosylaminoimidazole carboxylase atpase-subunit isoform 1 n=1 Tax=Hibiscus syriacus TaxID=106335 RepID=A0A6A3B4G4_HIBSY|nr:Phosphoribosylaminoimidazole carboxylase atpase-subunit isoform 1 [Hibiscus syriacus]